MAPGLTIGGTGAHTSVSFGFGRDACCDNARVLSTGRSVIATSFEVSLEMRMV
jgi:hypothetical protein